MFDAYVNALSTHLPSQSLTNEMLAADHPAWDMSRLEKKIGIKERRVVQPGECASDLAYEAGEKLLSSGIIARDAVDALLLCTQSPDYALPATACILQDRLRLSTRCAALDFNQGCSGYVYGLFLAKGLVASGLCRTVLLVTAETYSRYIHPDDRVVRPIFGDGATASLITANSSGTRIGDFALGTDGRGWSHLIVPAGGARCPVGPETRIEQTDVTGAVRTQENLFMDGRELFDFTLERVPEVVNELLSKTGRSSSNIDWYLMHQANAFMNDRLRTKLNIPKEKAPLVLENVGNTVSNTIPLAMAAEHPRFSAGDTLMLIGFGVGYSWGACLLEWGDISVF